MKLIGAIGENLCGDICDKFNLQWYNSTMTHEEEPQTPPSIWYTGIAFCGEGIRFVCVNSDAFTSLHPDLPNRLADWEHTQLLPNEAERRSPETVEFHAAAAAFIHEVTGFSAEELTSYARSLRNQYKGQSEEPFPFPVEWFEKK